ncbi:MAG TPA: hypothetical protein VI636_00235 [Candidatus Angelobacter sp.]
MPENKESSRVLSRLRARELSAVELDNVGAGFAISNACTFDPKTCHMDLDCPVPIRCPI